MYVYLCTYTDDGYNGSSEVHERQLLECLKF